MKNHVLLLWHEGGGGLLAQVVVEAAMWLLFSLNN